MTTHSPSPRFTRRFLTLAALTAIGGMSALVGAAASVQSNVAAQGPGEKPTVVLVHGAWADASGWTDVIHRLQRDGYPVLAPANPLRGLDADAAYISSVLATIPGPVVLVGHSYGGAVLTNAANGHANVKALVYIAAFIPEEGEDTVTMVSRFPGSQLVPPGLPGATLIPRPYPLPDGAHGIDAYIDPAQFRRIFAADISDRDAAILAATQRPAEAGILQAKSGPAAWKSIPSWALVPTEDNTIGTENLRFMAQRAGARTVEVSASHAVLISRPNPVVDLIRTAAEQVE